MRDTISWPPRDTSRRGSAFMGIVVLSALISIVTFAYAAVSGRAADDPVVVPAAPTGPADAAPAGSGRAGYWSPRGGPLPGGELHLLVADPPTVLDVQSGTAAAVPHLPDAQRVHHVLEVGDAAVIVGTRSCLDCVPSGEAFVLRDGRAVSLGAAWSVAPSLDAQGVWILRYVEKRRCMLREVGLDGRVRRPDRSIDCRARLRKEIPAGLLVDVTLPRYGPPDSALLDPATGSAVGRYPHVDALTRHFTLARGTAPVPGSSRVAGKAAKDSDAGGVSAEPHGGFVLTDLRSETQRPLPWPSRLDRTDGSAAAPDGRFLAVKFAAPAVSGPRQPMDLWVLDTVARRWRQLPGMPVLANVEHTGMAWTPDGRLVILGTFAGFGDAVAIWCPGSDELVVRRVELPDDRSTDSFAVLATASRGR